jgi:hypothetical protein
MAFGEHQGFWARSTPIGRASHGGHGGHGGGNGGWPRMALGENQACGARSTPIGRASHGGHGGGNEGWPRMAFGENQACGARSTPIGRASHGGHGGHRVTEGESAMAADSLPLEKAADHQHDGGSGRTVSFSLTGRFSGLLGQEAV